MIKIMKRTTLILDENLIYQLKQLAAKDMRTLTDVVNETLQHGLAILTAPKPKKKLELPSRDMGIPLVDISDREALYEILEDQEWYKKRGYIK